jgi:hypothetical protein
MSEDEFIEKLEAVVLTYIASIQDGSPVEIVLELRRRMDMMISPFLILNLIKDQRELKRLVAEIADSCPY